MTGLSISAAWRKRAQAVIPGGSQTLSKGPDSFVQGVSPSFLVRGAGARVWDVDGNEYIDYILGLGPVILGHADATVNEAVRKQLELGVSFSLPHTLEVELAELLCSIIPCAEMVRFGKNGSDVTAGAIRVARAYTKRDVVVRCGYHGWQDWYIGSTDRFLGVPEATRALTLAFPYNDLLALHQLFDQHPGRIACVILEPISFVAPKPGFLEGVRELCSARGALLVFDEIIAGFRVHIGGAQTLYGVTPDLACFGKAMANGFPLSAIVGRAEVMSWFEQVFFSFTFGGETVSLAASLATIKALLRNDGLSRIGERGSRLQDGTNELLRQVGLSNLIRCIGLPQWASIRCMLPDTRDARILRSLVQQECIRRGILTHGNHMLSVAHDDTVISNTLEVYREVFPLVAEAVASGHPQDWLEGPPTQPAIRA